MKCAKHIFAILLTSLSSLSAFSADINVPAEGNIADAIRQAREMRRKAEVADSETININLTGATYRLYEPIMLRTEDRNLVIRGQQQTVISGGMRISDWQKKGKMWVADVPDFNGRPLLIRQMWVNGKKAVRARDVSDFEKMARIRYVDKQNRVLWVPASAFSMFKDKEKATYKNLEMVLHEMWCVSFLRVKDLVFRGDSVGVNFHEPESRIQFEHPWPSPMTGEHPSPFYLTNSLTLLDEPGEWFYDFRAAKIYYMPRKGEDMATADVEVPVLETLVRAEGTLDDNVSNIRFENICFSYTTWIRPSLYGHVPLQAGMYLTDAYKLRPQMTRENNHKLDNQGWLGRASAAVQLLGANNIFFSDCRFEHLGGHGVDFVWGVNRCSVERSTFCDIAMGGFVCGSFSPAEHETHKVYNPKDLREVCSTNTISACSLNDIGNEDWGCCAITAGYVAEMQIVDNKIFDIPYTGISLGWGWNRQPNCMHDNYVARNSISHYGRHMYDTAGIYTLSDQPGTIIEQNAVDSIYHPSYVHDPNHWFYLYTDEGSNHIIVRNNYTEAEKFLQNANGPDNVWENNGPNTKVSIRNK